jgi:hypothetical protein
MPGVSIAADRPELYVLGGASGNESVKAALVPNAVAIIAARAQAKAIADMLSLRLGKESLNATYAPGLSGDSTRGIGTTFSRDGVVAKFPAPNAAPPLQLHDVSNSNAVDQDYYPNLPIDVAHPENAIRERTYVQAYVPYRLLRFQTELDSNNGPIAIAAAPIVTKIRSVAGVVDAVASPLSRPNAVLYNVILRRVDRGAIEQIANIIAPSYASLQPEASFGLDPFIGDCAPVAREALRLTMQEGWRAALATALLEHVHLRHTRASAKSPLFHGLPLLGRLFGSYSERAADHVPISPTAISCRAVLAQDVPRVHR